MVAVSVVINDGLAVDPLVELNDRANGLLVGIPIPDAEDVMRRIVTDSPFVHGDFEVLATSAAGRLDLPLRVSGATWAEMMTRFTTARAHWRQSGTFWLDVEVEGYGLRYVARRPDVIPSPITHGNLSTLSRQWLLSFPVQPNPVVI